MAAPEPRNMQNPHFTFQTPHSAQPHAPVPGPSSSAPGTSTPAQFSSPGPSGHCVPQHLMHKNRLQEYAQRSNMPLPVYHTINEGLTHAPKFRATVYVDGKCYTSKNVFSVRKVAEQDVAKLAYEHIVTSIKDEGIPDVFEKTMFFKSILNECAAKMNLDKVTYRTFQMEGHLLFVSSLVFNGKSYVGDPARSKKEAEQLAARTAILSNLSDSRLGTRLSEVIKSKFRFCAAISNVKDSQHTSNVSHMASSGYVSVNAAPMTANNNNENGKKVEVALPEPSSRGLQQHFQMSNQEKYPEESKLSNLSQQAGEPHHIDDSLSSKLSNLSQQACEPRHIDGNSSSKLSNLSQQAGEPQHIDDSSSLKLSNLSQQAGEPQHIDDSSSLKLSNLSQQAGEPQHIDDSSSSKLSNLSQQAGEPQHIDDSSSSKKRKRNKKKANKQSRMDSLMPVATFPVNQAPPPCVAVAFPLGQPSCSVAQ